MAKRRMFSLDVVNTDIQRLPRIWRPADEIRKEHTAKWII